MARFALEAFKGWFLITPLPTNVPIHIENSQLICNANQLMVSIWSETLIFIGLMINQPKMLQVWPLSMKKFNVSPCPLPKCYERFQEAVITFPTPLFPTEIIREDLGTNILTKCSTFYSLKTSEQEGFSEVFRRYQKGLLA